jgi:hypothetical protein
MQDPSREPTSSGGAQHQQATDHAHILHEMNHVVGVLRAGLIPEVMEVISRDGAEDDECQGRNPGLPPDNNQQTTARFQDRGQNGENVRIRQALRADRGGCRTKIHEFFDTRADENKRNEDTADRQNRIVDASRGTDIRPHWTATHGGRGHRVAPWVNSHENAPYGERFLPETAGTGHDENTSTH